MVCKKQKTGRPTNSTGLYFFLSLSWPSNSMCASVCVPGCIGKRYNPSALCGASSLSTAASASLTLRAFI